MNIFHRTAASFLQNIRVAEAVYNVPWYEARTGFRKTLVIFLMQTQRPLEVGGRECISFAGP